MKLTDLPRDNLVGIFSIIPTIDLFSVAKVCKLFNDVLKKNFTKLFRSADCFNIAVVGEQGSGKTTLITSLIKQITKSGRGVLKAIFPPIKSGRQLSYFEQLGAVENPNMRPELRIYFVEIFLDQNKTRIVAFLEVPNQPKHKELRIAAFMSHLVLHVVSATPGETSTVPSKPYEWIHQKLGLTSFSMGIKHAIFVINKMDTVTFSIDIFEAISDEYMKLAKKCGFKTSKAIPVSALDGTNIAIASLPREWKTTPLIEQILNLSPPKISPQLVKESPLRVSVWKIMHKKSRDLLVAGYVVSGTLRVGKKVYIGENVTEVMEIRIHDEPLAIARPDDIVTIKLSRSSSRWFKRLRVLTDVQAPKIDKITAQLIVLPSQVTRIVPGFAPTFHFGTAKTQCTTDLISKVDKASGAVTEKAPRDLRAGEAAIVELNTKYAMLTEVYNPKSLEGKLGRFIVTDLNNIVAVGVVKSIQYFKRK